MLRIALFLCLGLGMLATTTANVMIDPPGVAPVPAVEDTQIQPGENREGKANSKTFNKLTGLLPSILSIISFDNDPCTGTDGGTGICYSQKECAAMEGTSIGSCAKGYGVCCSTSTSSACGSTISTSGASFTSPTSPYNVAGQCIVTLAPPAGTCQIRLDFETFDLLGPIEGDCTNDTFVVVGANEDGTEIPTLCGENGGQHMYVHIDNSEGPYQLIATTSAADYDRDWDVKVTYIGCDEDCAPNRCLQYHEETTGSIESFAFPTMLNNLKYAICFGYVADYCDIGMDFTRFDVGAIERPCTNDWLLVGTEKICGDFLDTTAQANATAGPISLVVMTDDDGSNVEEGFSGTYTMMGC